MEENIKNIEEFDEGAKENAYLRYTRKEAKACMDRSGKSGDPLAAAHHATTKRDGIDYYVAKSIDRHVTKELKSKKNEELEESEAQMIRHMKRYDRAYDSSSSAGKKLADHFYDRARSVAASDAVGVGSTAVKKSIARHNAKNEEVDESIDHKKYFKAASDIYDKNYKAMTDKDQSGDREGVMQAHRNAAAAYRQMRKHNQAKEEEQKMKFDYDVDEDVLADIQACYEELDESYSTDQKDIQNREARYSKVRKQAEKIASRQSGSDQKKEIAGKIGDRNRRAQLDAHVAKSARSWAKNGEARTGAIKKSIARHARKMSNEEAEQWLIDNGYEVDEEAIMAVIEDYEIVEELDESYADNQKKSENRVQRLANKRAERGDLTGLKRAEAYAEKKSDNHWDAHHRDFKDRNGEWKESRKTRSSKNEDIRAAVQSVMEGLKEEGEE